MPPFAGGRCQRLSAEILFVEINTTILLQLKDW